MAAVGEEGQIKNWGLVRAFGLSEGTIRESRGPEQLLDPYWPMGAGPSNSGQDKEWIARNPTFREKFSALLAATMAILQRGCHAAFGKGGET